LMELVKQYTSINSRINWDSVVKSWAVKMPKKPLPKGARFSGQKTDRRQKDDRKRPRRGGRTYGRTVGSILNMTSTNNF
jgi:hypothetical protein